MGGNFVFKEKKLVKDYSVAKICNPYLIDSKIIDIFVSYNIGIEGGLTVIFERDKERGILIFGYTELGEWIAFLQVGANQIVSLKYYDSEVFDRVNQLVQEYQII